MDNQSIADDMKLSDLPARELARLDAICLEFENQLGDPIWANRDWEQRIDELVQKHGGSHAELLRAELKAIHEEIVLGATGAETETLASTPNALPKVSSTSDPANHRVARAIDAVDSFPKPPTATPAGATAQLPAVGTEIGPYRLTQVLGQGGMGIVYRATDTRLDRDVAIKMLSVESLPSSILVDRFQREAKAVAALTHPHIVELFDVGVYEGMPYAVMEYLRGETLWRRLQSRRLEVEPVTPTMVRRWGLQLASALSTAHAAGVIHRDLKPENVMLVTSTNSDVTQDENRSLKLFDFGLSRSASYQQPPQLSESSVQDGVDKPSPTSGSPTRAGMILGTPGYMAPEQARGESVTPAADIFALGCILYEAFYGEFAFPGETQTRRYAAVLESTPRPDEARQREDKSLADLIEAMLSKDPAGRPTASEVFERIGAVSGGETVGLATLKSSSSVTSTRSVAMDASGNVMINRRRLVELFGGGVVGGLIGYLGIGSDASRELASIRSIGVLTFQPAGENSSNAAVGVSGAQDASERLSNGQFSPGELLAGLLNNELARLEGITVPKYVPMSASTPEEFREAAAALEVDAIVTGSYSEAAVEDDASLGVTMIDLKIISGRTGNLIKGFPIRTSSNQSLLEQTSLAQRVALAIRRELRRGEETVGLNDPSAFTCLMKGRICASSNSVEELEMALKCFQHAVSVDETYAEAHAGTALTSITLAGRVTEDRGRELIQLAQVAVDRSLRLAPSNPYAKLAEAMIDYQVLADFDSAQASLSMLAETQRNTWQVHHQLGWVELLRLNEVTGMQSLRRAAGLLPTSAWLRADLARAEWFRGLTERAISQLVPAIQSGKSSRQDDQFARQVLIDLYEQLGQTNEAAALDPKLGWKPGQSSDAYFEARRQRLAELPYGPFGETLNDAILSLRWRGGPAAEPAQAMLARLIAARLPMLPVLLCRHPAFRSMAMLDQAKETFSVLRLA